MTKDRVTSGPVPVLGEKARGEAIQKRASRGRGTQHVGMSNGKKTASFPERREDATFWK